MTVVGQCIGAHRIEEAKYYVVKLMGIAWIGAFGLPYGFKAAGDVKFSMIVSVSSMWVFRVALGIFLVKMFHLGLMAVWIGIFVD